MIIGLCGPSGTGKTTLANFIADTYDYDFITTSTKPLWEEHNIKSHKELMRMTMKYPEWGLKFQHDILNYRRSILEDEDNIVVDRTPIDNIVYFLMQNSHNLSEKECVDYIRTCWEDLQQIDKIIYLPFTDLIPLENDGMRITNAIYQKTTGALFDAVIRGNFGSLEYYLKPGSLQVITVWDWTTRIAEAVSFIDHKRDFRDKLINFINSGKWE